MRVAVARCPQEELREAAQPQLRLSSEGAGERLGEASTEAANIMAVESSSRPVRESSTVTVTISLTPSFSGNI